jgi:CRP-like cAMP-binding protein
MAENVLLRSLPRDELRRIEQHFRIEPLTFGQRLSSFEEPLRQLYFPLEGAVSRLVQLSSGEAVEVGLIGCDGAIGVPLALGAESGFGLTRVQIAGSAAVLSAEDFQAQIRACASPLLDVLLAYANLQLQIVTHLAACHCLHRIEQRLSRCILQLLDRAPTPGSVRITHETLAEFLGVHRPSITYALQALVTEKVIDLERRLVIVLDRHALQSRACECYRFLRLITGRELERISKAPYSRERS